MLELDKKYLEELDQLAEEIQQSEELAAYLEEEDEAYFEQLKANYEPRIEAIYEKVAAENPLQLIALERRIMQEDFEGLFLPRLLGYSVLRGELDQNFKYVRPQDHFKEVLLAICNSPNFEILKKRIGQSIQMGFAFSSDIWVTNLINSIENKRIRHFLQAQKLDKYRTVEGRRQGYAIYARQFRAFNYMTAEFPRTVNELKVLFGTLKEFLIYRIERNLDNSTLVPYLLEFVANEEFKGHDEHLQIMGIFAMFFDLEDDQLAILYQHFNETRKKHPNFIEKWLELLLELHDGNRLQVDAYADARIYRILDHEQQDDLTAFYELMATIHSTGYNSQEAMDAVRHFYSQHEGHSLINECVRKTIFLYFKNFITNLEETDYPDFFEIAKVFTVYMNIFGNEKFNLNIKHVCMDYVQRLLKYFTDKRGKDYQDIKKFVSSTFVDLGFLKEKEVVELFKTRRKRKATAS
ncbi:MAG: hypothetical protein KatS3mg030_627 [Saprospiraceae bacterium]|nr:MAG: hypothetical protein KatS3mg029_0473 [Saprospiraceae bacterium]GIV32325.1 MAG: hypothetical protein KatS3mg030_627 [Saprospiraceae bacterium]